MKWGSCDATLVQKEDEFLQYEFNTAWGPPVDFFHKIAEDWPQLDFHLQYEEPGMGFRGGNEWKAGSLVGEFAEEYNHDEDEDDE